jgi:hypothetical protein
MRQAIGSVPLYNIIIVFIVITFGFLSATLSYVKAFKVNSNIAKQLERYEGYNSLSEEEINNILSTLGYRVLGSDTKSCPTKKIGNVIENKNDNYNICIYESSLKNGYFNYGILTYIYMDIPIIGGTFKIPVYTESERIFKFSPN